MCLFVENAGIASLDITVYKAMIRFEFKDGDVIYSTPLRKEMVPPTVMAGVNPFVAQKSHGFMYDYVLETSPDGKSCLMQEDRFSSNKAKTREKAAFASQGFIHCYSSLTDLRTDWHYWRSVFGGSYSVSEYSLVVFECVVPKGTLYCTGLFGDTPAMCAERLVFKKEINFPPEEQKEIEFN